MAWDAGVAVVGAGVIGLACAEQLAAAGHDVLVLDADRIGDGATGAALGALMPHAPTAPTPLADAQMDSLAAMPGWIAGIEARSGLGTDHRRVGRIEILSSPRAAAQADAKIAAARERWAALSDRDMPLRRIDGEAARAAVPHIADAPHGYLADDVTAQIDPPKLLAGLAGACRAAGARVLDHAPVRTLQGDGDGVTLDTGAGAIRAGDAVIAAGIGTTSGAPLTDPPIRAVKGEAMRLPGLGDGVPRPVVTGPGGFALTRTDGLAVGSTSDRTAPLERTVTRDGLHALMGRARKLLAIDPATYGPLVWSGFRPAAPDGQPVIGPHPTQPRVVLALGHFKTGLSLAPGTAMAITAIIAGRTPAAPWRAFDPARFAGRRPDAGKG
jgi:glycine oxidase